MFSLRHAPWVLKKQTFSCFLLKKYFHSTVYQQKRIPFLLADIGEGITECEIVQW
jgi:hypothetical protein